jgi:hypothetical protein
MVAIFFMFFFRISDIYDNNIYCSIYLLDPFNLSSIVMCDFCRFICYFDMRVALRHMMKSAFVGTSSDVRIRRRLLYLPRLYHCNTQLHPHNGSLFRKKSASSRDQCLQTMRNPPVQTDIRLSVANPQARDQIPDEDHPSRTIANRIAMGRTEQARLQDRARSKVTS